MRRREFITLLGGALATVPEILNELKSRGYKIVHVVPAAADRPKTVTSAEQWVARPTPEQHTSSSQKGERTHENRRRVPLRLHQGRRRRGPGEDYGLPLHGLPSRQWLRLPRQCSGSGCDLSHNGPAGDIPQDHGRERQSTIAGVLSALRLTDLFDIAGGGAAGVLHGKGGNLAPAP